MIKDWRWENLKEENRCPILSSSMEWGLAVKLVRMGIHVHEYD